MKIFNGTPSTVENEPLDNREYSEEYFENYRNTLKTAIDVLFEILCHDPFCFDGLNLGLFEDTDSQDDKKLKTIMFLINHSIALDEAEVRRLIRMNNKIKEGA